MRILVTLLGAVFFASMLFLAGCGSEEAPAGPVVKAPEPGTGDTATPEKKEPETATPGEEAKAGEEGENGEENTEEPPDGPIQFDRVWPNDPRAREVLPDPDNNDIVYS